jgi:hypothetical protein
MDCVCKPGDACVFHASRSEPKRHNVSEFRHAAHVGDHCGLKANDCYPGQWCHCICARCEQ